MNFKYKLLNNFNHETNNFDFILENNFNKHFKENIIQC